MEAKLLGPVQPKVTPDVFELPDRGTEVTLQVSVTPALAMAVGVVLFCITVVLAKEVHPFAGFVTVRE